MYGPDIQVPVYGHCAVTIDENYNQILVIGGKVVSGAGTKDSATIFDFTTQQWSDAGSMSVPRHRMTCTRATLSGKDVVVVAGGGHDDNTWSSVDFYDIGLGEW